MADANDTDRVWRLIEKIGICMLSTHDGADIRARPMAAHIDRDERAIYFLTDTESPKGEEIAKNPRIGLAFADTGEQEYASVSGDAAVSDDRQKIRELWSTPARAWWSSPDDPSLRVLKFIPREAQYWDSAGTVATYVKLMSAAVSGNRPEMGAHGDVKM